MLPEVARKIFLGPGFVLIEILLVSVVGWAIAYIAAALGKKQISALATTATVFICIILVLSVIVEAVTKVTRVMGF